MKTTEELRQELDKLRKEEFDACLDSSNKIKPLEEQLSASEKGDILFSNTRVRAKIEKLNKLFKDKGYPLFIARKSDYQIGLQILHRTLKTMMMALNIVVTIKA